jgi:hypothetical protein
MAPILAPLLGVHFFRGHISLKNGKFCPLLATIQRLSKTCAFLSKKRSIGCFVWAAPSLLLALTYFIIGVVSLIATFFERVAEVRDSPNSLRIEMKTYHIMLTMGMY